MLVSVSALGSRARDVNAAAGLVVAYLHGTPAAGVGHDHRHSTPGSSPTPLPTESIGSYYADSLGSPGRWRGEGASPEFFDLGENVDPETLGRVLKGQHPTTGDALVTAQGSSVRANGYSAWIPSSGGPDDLLSVAEVAEIVGVDPSYVRRVAKTTASVREAQLAADLQGTDAPETPDVFLDAVKDDQGRWLITRAEANRFASARDEPQVVMGYDVTFSVPKSVSALYAVGTDDDRKQIDDAIESAVAAGMGYIEREGFVVRRQGQQERAGRMVAASYRHYTNRALEPQLHEHVVIANMATNSLGQTRALDGRGLFAHATTAGYLSGAQLRHELAQRFGIAWQEVHKGLADIEGVSRDVVMSISSRRQAVLGLAEEMGYFTASARQKAAVATRPGKEHGVEASELRQSWINVLSEAGFDRDAAAALARNDELQLWRPDDTDALFAHLASHRGVTEQHAIFDRRDVLQAIATHANDRLTATEIEDLADHWLATEAVVPLEVNDGARRETIGHGQATVSLAPNEQRYTTPQMLELERRVIDTHERGLGSRHGTVDARIVENAITHSEVELGADQASMVRAITTSGDQFQAAIGRAGAGKTTALRAAVAAWQNDGYDIIGAAPFGEAARKLEAETGLTSHTLEGLLTRIETAADPRSVLPPNAVIIVDEASTIGNRQLDRLYRHAVESNATVRMIGDPQQHQSVEAGGLWKHLTEEFAAETPSLDINRRQVGDEMTEVRQALDEYRHGLVAKALHRLDADDRVVTATNWEDLLDTMAADWFLDHQRHQAGAAEPSKMIAERNSDRHALNRRAQSLLREAGQLGDHVRIGDTDFHRGDRVVAQARNLDLRAPGADRRHHVINGSEGTVTGIIANGSEPDLLVDFDNLGTIRVPHGFIATEVGRGRGGGLTPAYALTSYKAEGQTYDTGRNLAAPGAVNTEGMYVALTRGRHGQRAYTIAPADQATEPPELPIIADTRSALDALADSLSKRRGEDLATVADPSAQRVAIGSDLAARGRAGELAHTRIAANYIFHPPAELVAHIGERPSAGTRRGIWDDAAAKLAGYQHQWPSSEAGEILGPIPSTATPAQREARLAASDALSIARAEHLASIPFAEFVQRFDAVLASIPTADGFDPTASDTLVAQSTARVSEARAALDRARSDRTQAEGLLGRGRRNMNAVEAARRSELTAERALATANADLSEARALASSAEGSAPARAHTQGLRTSYDDAMNRRIERAVRRPADYLNDALGPRPAGRAERAKWNSDAKAIESFRHRHLRLEPPDGPRPGAGLLRAIGPMPRSSRSAVAWQKIRAEAAPAPEPRQQVMRRGR